ncbi:hypothetical protein GCM10017673_27630 [Streptosporangium violaceochromogenes]|nr:hypothetical protein GCM10017673_27630 [Streptosporangium violaceochromogenes]
MHAEYTNGALGGPVTPRDGVEPFRGRDVRRAGDDIAHHVDHAAVSLWLNAGVHAPEVAERAGHGVDVLLKVYARCIDGQHEAANRRIVEALSI